MRHGAQLHCGEFDVDWVGQGELGQNIPGGHLVGGSVENSQFTVVISCCESGHVETAFWVSFGIHDHFALLIGKLDGLDCVNRVHRLLFVYPILRLDVLYRDFFVIAVEDARGGRDGVDETWLFGAQISPVEAV